MKIIRNNKFYVWVELETVGKEISFENLYWLRPELPSLFSQSSSWCQRCPSDGYEGEPYLVRASQQSPYSKRVGDGDEKTC